MFNLIKSTKRSYLYIRHVTTVTNIDVTSSPTKPFSEVPGPAALPVIGQLYHFLPGGSLHNLRGFDLQNYLYEKYGPVVKMKGNFGAPDTILLFDPEVSLQIYRSENSAPVRPGFFAAQYYKHVIKKEKGEERKYNGLIFDHDDTWRDMRAVVSPVIMQAKSLKPYAEPLDEIAQEVVASHGRKMVQTIFKHLLMRNVRKSKRLDSIGLGCQLDQMKSIRNEHNMLKNNFLDEIMSYVIEFTGQIAFGYRFHAFDPSLSEDSVARQLLKNIKNFFTLSDKLDFQPNPWRYYPNKTFRRAMKTIEDAEKLNEKLIRTAIEKLKTDPKPEEKKGVLEKVAEKNEDMAVAFTDDMFFVGIDTVSNGIISVLYLLAINPDKQNKLREEVLSKPSRRPYIKACIKEAARIRPVAFGNIRLTTNEYNVFDYQIPKDTWILFCHENMSIREEQFPLPRQYIPERWLVDKDDPLYHGNAHPLAATHFGYGARGCVGRKVADMEMEILLSRIIENFNIEWRGDPMKVYQSVTNHNMAPYNFVFNDL